MVETMTYALALALVVLAPPAFAAWLFVHPWIGYWRRLGPAVSYTLLAIYYTVSAGAIFALREPILASRFPFEPALAAAGAGLVAVALGLRLAIQRHLTAPIMFGRPELDPRDGDPLLTEGIYASIRHPRYVEAFLGIAGIALVTNYHAAWLVTAAYVPIMALVIRLEEYELAERFGSAWHAYTNRVPRLFPRLTSRG